MKRFLDLVDRALRQIERRPRNSATDVMLVNKAGKVTEHRQTMTRVTQNTVVKRERIRIFRP